MKFKEIEKFLDDCFNAGVEVPRDLTIVCTDFFDGVPEEFQSNDSVEFNYRPSDDDMVTINVCKPRNPKPATR